MAKLPQIMAAGSKRRLGLSQAVSNSLARQVAEFDGWYNPRLERELVAGFATVVDNAAQASAVHAMTYGDLVLATMTGRQLNTGQLNVTGSQRLGLSTAEAYARIPRHYGYIRSEGYSQDAAIASTINRIRRMADLDMSLAYRAQLADLLARNVGQVQGYRRVLRPELSRTGPCGLCVAASDRIYPNGELMPIHAGCCCEILPIIGDYDPGFSLNTDDIRRLYRTASPGRVVGAPTRAELSNVRVVVEEHGEYGPILRDSKETRKNIETVRAQERNRLARLRQGETV